MKIVHQLLILFLCLAPGRMYLTEDPQPEVPCSVHVVSQSTCNVTEDSRANLNHSDVDDNTPISLEDVDALLSIPKYSGIDDITGSGFIDPVALDHTEIEKQDRKKNSTLPFLPELSVKVDAKSTGTVPLDITDKIEYTLQKSDVAMDNITTLSGTTDKTADVLQNSEAAMNNATSPINITARTNDASQRSITALNIPTIQANTSDKVGNTVQRYNTVANDTFILTNSTDKTEEALQIYNIAKNNTITPVTNADKTEYTLQTSNAALNVTAVPANTSGKTKDAMQKSAADTPTNLKDRNDKDGYNNYLVVRKCCGNHEYISLTTGQCEISENSTLFDDYYVEKMHLGDHSGGIKHETGKISKCPSSGDSPEAIYITGIHLLTDIGYLRDNESEIEYNHDNYCLEVAMNDSHNVADAILLAGICSRDRYNTTQNNIQSKSQSIKKCCPFGSYLDNNYTTFYCTETEPGSNLDDEPLLKAANISISEYDFPECLNDSHVYPFTDKLEEDFAIIGDEKIMTLVSMENGCFIKKTKLNNNDYCIDKDGKNKTMIIVCLLKSENDDIPSRKNNVIAVLSGISCVALIATTFSLTSERIRRGSTTAKRINTLTGKNLLSYVLSYLMTFLILAISVTANIEIETPSCLVLAGLMIYFPLSAFLWNTSICLDILLLTIRVRMSEKNRYLLYSIFSWGVPGIITAIALTLDSYKDRLPCSVIIPRIGLYRCFFSDDDAQLLYFYLPMFLSLCANLGFLLSSRYIRSARRKKLAESGKVNNENTNVDATEMQEQQSNRSSTATEMQEQQSNRSSAATEMQEQQSNSNQNTDENARKTGQSLSGLRIHHIRNLWVEALKLVAWSGVSWMAEFVAFLMRRFMLVSGSWYNYLWYLPISINALRGVGIFIIVVLTPETRKKILKSLI